MDGAVDRAGNNSLNCDGIKLDSNQLNQYSTVQRLPKSQEKSWRCFVELSKWSSESWRGFAKAFNALTANHKAVSPRLCGLDLANSSHVLYVRQRYGVRRYLIEHGQSSINITTTSHPTRQ